MILFKIDNWHEIYRILRSNKLRTLLTAFGIFWGVFMLVLMVGVGKGFEYGSRKKFGNLSVNSFFIWPQSTTKPYNGYKQGRNYTFSLDDVRIIKSNIRSVEFIAPQLNGKPYGSLLEYNNKTGNYSMIGNYPDYMLKIDPVNIIYGRIINNIDIKEKRKVVLIGYKVYCDVFGKNEDPINKLVKIGSVYFTVVGVFNSLHSDSWALHQDNTIVIPYTTFQKLYGIGTNVWTMALIAKDSYDCKITDEKVRALLRKQHKIHPEDKSAINGYNLGSEYKKMNDFFDSINLMIWIIGIGTLLAGVFGVTNIMYITVSERISVFGIQRAIGAEPKQIFIQVIVESMTLTFIAGYLGLCAGIVVVETVAYLLVNNIITNITFGRPEVNINIALISLLIIIVSGIVAGFMPARHATKIKPIDAIRTNKD
ncbi:MAG: ABC transporter permease [Bacteroidales bacterium]|nr:ABC transporter permease [Bacteroidales bacterium]